MQSIISQTHLWTFESWLQNEDHRAEFPALSTSVLTVFTLVPVTPDSQSRSHFLSFLNKCSEFVFSLLHCANQIVFLRSPTERFEFISSFSFEFKIVNFQYLVVVFICLGVGKESEKGSLKNGLSRDGFGVQNALGFALATLLCLSTSPMLVLLPAPSITKDLKPIFFACDSFSWQAEMYISSCVLACL